MTRSVWIAAVALALAACQTGARPTITNERQADPAVLAVTRLLDRARINGDFTGTYQITPTMVGSPTVDAVVTTNGTSATIAVGQVLYVIDSDVGETCNLDRTECESGINDARVSDLSITHAFWADSAAARLRNDAGRAIGTPQSTPQSIADQPATCVDVPVAGGTIVYCALEAGPLASYRGADTTIELTSFTPGADVAPNDT